MRIKIAFLLTLLTLLTITSCDDAKRKVEKEDYADSLINAAQKEGHFERMLALVDSLEPTGLLSDIRINQARGWVYNRMGQKRRAEIYYLKVVNAEPQNDQQRALQNTVAINLTSRQVAKGDYEAALKVAIPTVKRMEQHKEQNTRALGALYNTIGACQLNLGHDEEAEKYYEQAFNLNMQVCEKDEQGIDTRQSIDATVNTVIDYCNAKKYKMVEPWLQRAQNMIDLYEHKPNSDPEGALDFRIRLHLLEAIALQGLGETKKAALIYESAKDSNFGRSADGRLTANDYLLAAGRYSEAADNFKDLDHVIADWGLDLYATMKPAKEVGGDLYAYLLVEDLLYFCVGDVSGKGVPASLFMAQVARMFRTLSAQRMQPQQIATEMNNELTEDNEMGMFVTLFIGLANLTTGHLSYCNAGHNPPVLGDGDLGGRFMDVESNAPIGLWPDLQFVGQEVESIKGRPLFVYSDGLNEAENKEQEMFGDEQLLEMLHQTRYETAQQVIEVMEKEVEKHRNGALPNDDLTMLCLRVN